MNNKINNMNDIKTKKKANPIIKDLFLAAILIAFCFVAVSFLIGAI